VGGVEEEGRSQRVRSYRAESKGEKRGGGELEGENKRGG
jgi:hypothetical protein